MRHTILLVSRDKALLETRALLLQRVGYPTLKASTLIGAAGLAFCCQLAIIDRTFASKNHEEFVDRVHGDHPDFVVLSLRTVLIQPEALIDAVRDALAALPGGPKVVIIE
jgi:hypothetical protein